MIKEATQLRTESKDLAKVGINISNKPVIQGSKPGPVSAPPKKTPPKTKNPKDKKYLTAQIHDEKAATDL